MEVAEDTPVDKKEEENVIKTSTFSELIEADLKKESVTKSGGIPENGIGETEATVPENGNIGGSNTVHHGEAQCAYALTGYERKALFELRSRLEEAIQRNKMGKGKKQVFDENATEDSSVVTEQPHETEEMTEKEGDRTPTKETEEKTKKSEKTPKKENGKKSKNREFDAIDKDVSIWGVPLLPSKNNPATDTILLKFLRSKDFKVSEAFELLKNSLRWRKENSIDSILEEDFGDEYNSVGFMSGYDHYGQPVCYNVFGGAGGEEVFSKLLGTSEKRQRFIRWRVQLMEKGIKMLDFRPGGVNSLVQVNDLKSTPLPARKDFRSAIIQTLIVLQDNYPEFAARNILINVPFWYYALSAVLPAYLTPRTRSKFLLARPTRGIETLLKYIPGQQIPVQFGGLKREGDPDFSIEDPPTELLIKSVFTETVEILVPEVGKTLIWDVNVSGWDVKYKEEFVPTDDDSYTILVKREAKIGWRENSLRNSYTNKEPGKLVIYIDNASFKKKRLLYRYKIKNN